MAEAVSNNGRQALPLLVRPRYLPGNQKGPGPRVYRASGALQLLFLRHRSEEAQKDLMTIRIRAALVESRTGLVNAARGLTKTTGERLASCDADQMETGKLEELPADLRETLKPLLAEVESLTEKIKECDRKVEQIARDRYPETKLLRQVSGVGPLIALTYVLTIEDKERFKTSRDVGCYVGLRPKQSASGERQPELRITKEGDVYLRKLLVQERRNRAM